MTPIERLKEILSHDKILSSDLDGFKTDESGEIGETPLAVLFPESDQEIQSILKWANTYKVPVIPRAGATGKAGGCTSSKESVVLCLDRFNSILKKDSDNRILSVQAAVKTQDVKTAATEMGLYYPPDPGSLETCTIGGNIACNSGGPRAVKYGVTGNYVLGVEGVLANGEKFAYGSKNHKDVAGYDLKSLMIGSEGTLGIVTTIHLKLIQPPKVVKTLWIGFDHIKDALQTLLDAFTHHIDVAAAEFFDEVCFRALQNYVGDSLPFRSAKAHIIFECHGYDDATVTAQINQLLKLATANNLIDQFVGEDLWQYRYKISPSLSAFSDFKKSQDISVPPGQILKYLEVLGKMNRKTELTVLGYGHLGDGNIHVNILGNSISETLWKTESEKIEKECLHESLKLGGTVTGEHGIGLEKRPYLTAQLGIETRQLMAKIKATFDPNNILNPDKAI